jgi:hypothetical protein
MMFPGATLVPPPSRTLGVSQFSAQFDASGMLDTVSPPERLIFCSSDSRAGQSAVSSDGSRLLLLELLPWVGGGPLSPTRTHIPRVSELKVPCWVTVHEVVRVCLRCVSAVGAWGSREKLSSMPQVRVRCSTVDCLEQYSSLLPQYMVECRGVFRVVMSEGRHKVAPYCGATMVWRFMRPDRSASWRMCGYDSEESMLPSTSDTEMSAPPGGRCRETISLVCGSVE